MQAELSVCGANIVVGVFNPDCLARLESRLSVIPLDPRKTSSTIRPARIEVE